MEKLTTDSLGGRRCVQVKIGLKLSQWNRDKMAFVFTFRGEEKISLNQRIEFRALDLDSAIAAINQSECESIFLTVKIK